MNILMWTEDPVAATRARIALDKYKMPMKICCGSQLEHPLLLQNNNLTQSVLIADRIKPNARIKELTDAGWIIFFIIEQWPDLSDYETSDFFDGCRFYLWPVNWEMLTDDIRAVCLAQQYLAKGFIDGGALFIDQNLHTLTDGKRSVRLRNKEYDLLSCLMKNRGKLLTRNALMEMVWDMNTHVSTNTVDVHISRIRKIIGDNFGLSGTIKTIPCAGYLYP